MDELFDVVIIGAGPSGLTAGIYCGRAELKTMIIEKFTAGGQMATTAEIENFPGFPKGTDAVSLAMDMQAQAKNFGVLNKYKSIKSLELEGEKKVIVTEKGEKVYAKSVIIATGASPRELGVQGEKEFRGRGVSYCATCDGAFFRGKTVAVVGGGDTAAADAIFLSKICKKVLLIHRRDKLRAAKIYETRLSGLDNVEFVWNSKLELIKGDKKVEEIKIITNNQEERIEAVDGVFIAVGVNPSTEWLGDLLELDYNGFIVAEEDTKTSIPGVFASGDCRTKPLRQVVTAAADGAVAAIMAEEYINTVDF